MGEGKSWQKPGKLGLVIVLLLLLLLPMPP